MTIRTDSSEWWEEGAAVGRPDLETAAEWQPTPEEVEAAAITLSLEMIESMAEIDTEVRVDPPLESHQPAIETFLIDEQVNIESEVMGQFLTDEVEAALRTLLPRDATVLRLYFGLDGGREHTLEQIGELLGITRERVRQLRERALKHLRAGEVGRTLASFAA